MTQSNDQNEPQNWEELSDIVDTRHLDRWMSTFGPSLTNEDADTG